ncbi:LysM peptidoglycan-binding domain-containing protein [Mycobacterium sherrisii]|uniref:LysM peptidoglycan-binding domain-containing protein n=1 Tax=Mycobacterium sherrisii TaxID=243061 RepID=UPI002DDD0C60|nr:LysM peptidoglycan-binding domain-containing protein [Mycobacterium sherrisii]MEC4765368.1 LysM peptidoglycan-binding domain-containing protein [Mycobacterium sherrisii]
MTLMHTVTPRTGGVRRPADGLVARPRYDHERALRPRRSTPARPAGTPMRYRGTGVAMSVAPHRPRPVTVQATLGLALMAGIITLWLGLMANLGQIANGEPASAAAPVPDRLSVVQVEPGESLQYVAHRVAPAAPAAQVADRIRELNNLSSPALAAGQTLIAPVG